MSKETMKRKSQSIELCETLYVPQDHWHLQTNRSAQRHRIQRLSASLRDVQKLRIAPKELGARETMNETHPLHP